MSRTSKKSKIIMPSEVENRRILAAAKSDPDAQPLKVKGDAINLPQIDAHSLKGTIVPRGEQDGKTSKKDLHH
jgi:hypothetical protein